MSQQAAALSEKSVYLLSLWVFGMGALIVFLVIVFALALLYARRLHWRGLKQQYPLDMLAHELVHLLRESPRRREIAYLGAMISTAYAEHLARRNEFWITYGQTTVAVLLLIVVTVLLLTRTISPDAGLPILSGIGGFAIAKATGSPRGVPPSPPEGEQG
jgi:uncharacterized membrane protein YhaH (DUF805 family)